MAEPQILNPDDYNHNAPLIQHLLEQAFPGSHVVSEPGYQGRVRIKIVGSQFNNLDEQTKQATVWDVLRQRLHEGATAISWVTVYGDDEL